VPPHNKSTCYVMPAVHALVELTEPPWFVVPLEDIEVAHFERIVYGLKNFDLVFVMKDFSVKPVTVSAINVEHLDALKTWLDSCDIKFYEGPANLNWTQIMKHINSMWLEEFYEEGGWKNVLELEDSEGEEGEDPEDAESDFNPSESEEEEEASDSDEYEDEVDSEDDDSGEESMDSDESEGKDFETLEKEAKRADKDKGRYDEDERPKSKKRQDYSASESDSESGERPPKKAFKSSGGGSSKGGKPSSSKHSSSKPSSSKASSSSKGSGGKFFKRA